MRQTAVGVLCGLLWLGTTAPGCAQAKGKAKSKDGALEGSQVDRLRADLASENSEVRKKALNAIQHSLIRELAPEVVPLVDDRRVRLEAIYACGRLGRDARAAVPR